MTAIAALYSDEEGLCVVQGGRREGVHTASNWWIVCHMIPSSHLIGYFSPGSLPMWKSRGSEEWFIWV